MPIPLRILRAHADDLPGARPKLSPREQDRQDRILTTATSLIAHYGRINLTFYGLAIAMRMAPATLRRHFPDLDSILFELISNHLMAISRAIGEIPVTHPNRKSAQRAAYVAFTRGSLSATTEIHLLLVRERHTLPPDLAEQIDKLRALVGETLAEGHVESILNLLDDPYLQPSQIEAMLVALQNPGATPLKIIAKHGRPMANKPLKPAFYPKRQQAHARAGPIS